MVLKPATTHRCKAVVVIVVVICFLRNEIVNVRNAGKILAHQSNQMTFLSYWNTKKFIQHGLVHLGRFGTLTQHCEWTRHVKGLVQSDTGLIKRCEVFDDACNLGLKALQRRFDAALSATLVRGELA